MAKYRIGADVEFESLTAGELRGELDSWDHRRRAQMAQNLRGTKLRRLPQTLRGTPVGGSLTLGGDSGAAQVGPSQGNFWFIRLISITGLATGATPDILNMQIVGASSGLNWWQFNGNSFGTGWGFGEMWMEPGEYLQFTNQGALAATGLISVVGTLLQVPAEEAAALFGGAR